MWQFGLLASPLNSMFQIILQLGITAIKFSAMIIIAPVEQVCHHDTEYLNCTGYAILSFMLDNK